MLQYEVSLFLAVVVEGVVTGEECALPCAGVFVFLHARFVCPVIGVV